jgi:transcriptional regulator with PAS, ATPase and Fis domain
MNVINTLVTHVRLNEENNTYIINSLLVKKYNLLEIERHEDDMIYIDHTWKTACTVAKKNAIKRAMEKSGGDINKAVKLLGISIRTYYDWKIEIEEYETKLRNRQKQ